jgi:hypothetical protein
LAFFLLIKGTQLGLSSANTSFDGAKASGESRLPVVTSISPGRASFSYVSEVPQMPQKVRQALVSVRNRFGFPFLNLKPALRTVIHATA